VILSLFGLKKENYFGKKTYTYYIPAPPVRKNGYQEKEFDHITSYITQLGFDIIDFKIQAHSHSDQAGMWIVCLLGAKTSEIYHKRIDYNPIEQSLNDHHSSIPLDPSIIHDD